MAMVAGGGGGRRKMRKQLLKSEENAKRSNGTHKLTGAVEVGLSCWFSVARSPETDGETTARVSVVAVSS